MIPRRASYRTWLRRLHLWLGLGLGAIFAVVGVTGSALVYYIEIDAAQHSEVAPSTEIPAPGWHSGVWQTALATGQTRWPAPNGRWSFEVTGQGGPIPARYYPPDGRGLHPKREMVWFSADGSEIVRSEPWGGYLMSWLYQLHMELLMGEMGAQILA